MYFLNLFMNIVSWIFHLSASFYIFFSGILGQLSVTKSGSIWLYSHILRRGSRPQRAFICGPRRLEVAALNCDAVDGYNIK